MFEWWHWIILGLCLSAVELLVSVFFILWFGIGAIGVGLLLLAFPALSIAMQFTVWTILSSILVVIWFRYFRPRTVTAVGTSSGDVIGEVGVLINDLCPDSRGRVRFQKPVLGSDQWECYADQDFKAGDRVRIAAVEGNFIKVEPIE